MTSTVDGASVSEDEYLAFHAANEIADGEVVFVGIGVPSHAAVLAKRTHAPNATLIYESGAIGALPGRPPLSTGSPEVAEGARMLTDSLTVFAELQAGRIDVGLLSGAQVDLTGAMAQEHRESGRGLALIQALVSRVVFERHGDTNVWKLCRLCGRDEV